jgi:cytochrome c-type biogenesis protein CcmE
VSDTTDRRDDTGYGDDTESVDALEIDASRRTNAPLVDLTPRTVSPRRRRRWLPVLLIIVIVAAIGALLTKTLGDASLFFKNADEAVAQRTQLGDKRFRLQGTVVPGSISEGELEGKGTVFFEVSFNGTALHVAHVGNPPDLFKPEIPVVLEGHWTHAELPTGTFASGPDDGWYFASDRMLVKHDASYESENKARIKEAEDGGHVPVGSDPATPAAPAAGTRP